MITDVCIAILSGVFISGVLLRYILFWALSHRKIENFDKRERNPRYIPRLGGLAFFPAMLVSLLSVGAYALCTKGAGANISEHLFPEVMTLFFSGLFCYMIGGYDDLKYVEYRQKLFFQIICGILLVAWGPKIDDLQGFINIYTLHPVPSLLLSVFVVIFVMNSMNLIDGIDGLAAGISGIALLYYGAFFICIGHYFYALMAFAMLGSIIPFCIYNVRGFRNKHKIFMGDTGAYSLGLLLAFLGLSLYTQLLRNSCGFVGNPLILAFAPLAVPCLDLVRTFLHRLKIHEHPFKPDTNHIHHKLMDIGLSPHCTLLVLLAISIVYILFNVMLSDKNPNLILASDIISYTLLNIWLTRKMKHSPRLK